MSEQVELKDIDRRMSSQVLMLSNISRKADSGDGGDDNAKKGPPQKGDKVVVKGNRAGTHAGKVRGGGVLVKLDNGKTTFAKPDDLDHAKDESDDSKDDDSKDDGKDGSDSKS